ncbi:50S ribosomal protein L32 [Candidatus Uhrbacteria bacterium]|nr:50S ribosomal protein L32 [Candidatus Uhrbacteria bacterium]
MGLPGHRRTSSDKRRRAAHFALTKPALTVDPKSGLTHRSHCAAPGATEYRGIQIHIKGGDRRIKKILEKTKMKTSAEPPSNVPPSA